MATSGNGSYKMEGVRGGLHPAVDINRLNKKKKKTLSNLIQLNKTKFPQMNKFST